MLGLAARRLKSRSAMQKRGKALLFDSLQKEQHDIQPALCSKPPPSPAPPITRSASHQLAQLRPSQRMSWCPDPGRAPPSPSQPQPRPRAPLSGGQQKVYKLSAQENTRQVVITPRTRSDTHPATHMQIPGNARLPVVTSVAQAPVVFSTCTVDAKRANTDKKAVRSVNERAQGENPSPITNEADENALRVRSRWK